MASLLLILIYSICLIQYHFKAKFVAWTLDKLSLEIVFNETKFLIENFNFEREADVKFGLVFVDENV